MFGVGTFGILARRSAESQPSAIVSVIVEVLAIFFLGARPREQWEFSMQINQVGSKDIDLSEQARQLEHLILSTPDQRDYAAVAYDFILCQKYLFPRPAR